MKELEKVFVREAVGKVIYILYEMPLRNTQIKSSQYLFFCSKLVLVVIQTGFQPNTEAKGLRAANRKPGIFSLLEHGRNLSALHPPRSLGGKLRLLAVLDNSAWCQAGLRAHSGREYED